MSIRLSPAIYIDTNAKLAALIYLLKQEPIIAVDTESNSMYAYHERVCLVQISTPTHDYIIDPLVIDRMDTLNDVFADRASRRCFTLLNMTCCACDVTSTAHLSIYLIPWLPRASADFVAWDSTTC